MAAGSALGKVYVAITGNINPLKKSLAAARRLVDKFGRALIRLAKKGITTAFKLAGRIISSVINKMKTLVKWTGLAAAGFVAWSIKFGAGFEQSMARVQALTEATTSQFKELEETARSLGRQTVFTANQAADAMGFLALAGFKTNQIMMAMPSVLNLAAAGQLEIASAADITAKIMAGMGIEAKDLGKAVDVLAKAFTTSNTDLMQLGEALKFVGPVGRAAGKDLKEIVAVIQVLSNAGLQGSLAGTSLRNMLARLSGGVPAQAKALKKLGIEIADSGGKLKPMADLVDQLNEKLGNLSGDAARTAVIMNIFGLRAGPGMSALLAQGGDAIRKYEMALEKSKGTAKSIADIMLDTLGGAFIKLKSIIADVSIEISTRLSPAFKAYIESTRAWITENKDLIVAWAEFFVFKIIEAVKVAAAWFKLLVVDWKSAMDLLFIETEKLIIKLAPVAKKLGVIIGKGILEGLKRMAPSIFKAITSLSPVRLAAKAISGPNIDDLPSGLATRASSSSSGPESTLKGMEGALFEINKRLIEISASNKNIDSKTKDPDTIN